MLVSRLNLIYNFPFSEIKKYFSKFTETEISPNQYIYYNPLFFLTITDKKDKTVFEFQDSNLSFPSNKLDMSLISFDKIFTDIPPDKVLVDFQYSKDINLDSWSRNKKFLQKDDFKLFKRCENTINFSTISVNNNFLNLNEFVQTFNNVLEGKTSTFISSKESHSENNLCVGM